jgi:hypothetical protein
MIQYNAIREYLLNHGFDKDDNFETARWIKKNAKAFRDYLNTIKLVYIIWYCSNKKYGIISWEEFCMISDKLMETKEYCLDYFY